MRGFKTKVFLKRYARRYLADNVVNRRKRGLSVPIGSWLRGPLKEWAAATLEKGRLQQAAMEFFSEHCERKADPSLSGPRCVSGRVMRRINSATSAGCEWSLSKPRNSTHVSRIRFFCHEF